MLASIVNYLLYPLLSRQLSPSDMGDVGVVFTIVIQAGSILLALNLISIYTLSHYKEAKAHRLLEAIQNSTLKLSLFVCASSIFIYPLLKTVLKIDSYSSLVGMTCLLIMVVPALAWTGYIQGKKALGLLGVYNVINSLAKTAGAVIFASLGYRASGTIFGFLIGFIASLLILRKITPFKLPGIINRDLLFSRRKYLRSSMKRYVVSSFVLTIVLSAFYSLDILSAKINLSQEHAGIYISLSTLAGAVYFLIMTVSWIITPNYSNTNESHNLKLLGKTILGAIAITATATLLFWWQGRRIVSLTLGEPYSLYSSILWKITISQGIIAITSTVAFYQKVRGKSGAVYIAISPFMFAAALVIFYRVNDLESLVNRMLLGELTGIIVCAIVLTFARIKRCIK